MIEKEAAPRRIISLDQFRGYTVAGMLFVNFLGGYVVIPAVFKHHNTYCSYADTIMPQFFFAVGFAFRLTFLRRLETNGALAATRAVFNRALALVLLGFVIYHLDGEVEHWSELQKLGLSGFLRQAFKRELCQTLVQIALTSIWVLPVIAAGPLIRAGFMIASAGLHLWLSSWFYLEWAWKSPAVIDGGWLGILTWTIPTLVGSLAYDAVKGGKDDRETLSTLVVWSMALMVVGYLLSCAGGNLAAPPFVPPAKGDVTLWTMSQRTGSVSYLTFAAGFSLAVYALFFDLCDRRGWQTGLFRIFGQNALVAYVVHPMVASAVKPYLPKDCPFWYLALGFSLYFGICIAFNWYLERHRLFVRL
jgi:predicted acyltransferase